MRRGLTVVEILVVLALISLVVALLVDLPGQAARNFARSEERVDTRLRTARAFTMMRLALLDAYYYQSEPDRSGLLFESPSGVGRIRWERAAGRLMLRRGGEAQESVLVDRGVIDFAIGPRSTGILAIGLELAPVNAAIGPRQAPNRLVHEIFLPSIALRDTSIPWVRHGEPLAALKQPF